jgi:hypothetical protein
MMGQRGGGNRVFILYLVARNCAGAVTDLPQNFMPPRIGQCMRNQLQMAIG